MPIRRPCAQFEMCQNGYPIRLVEPRIIQGGMGVAVSDWRLARAVSLAGQLGVVSGTALDVVLARRLQDGDPGGYVRQALDHFPLKDVAKRILDRYFVEDGKEANKGYKSRPVYSQEPPEALTELTVAANFVEVWLAKHGHSGPVGINLLEKIQLPTVHSLFGAVLAGVDYVLMGAGIPRHVPGILDRLSNGEVAELKLDVHEAKDTDHKMSFDPRQFLSSIPFPTLKRPNFLAIISSATLAIQFARRVGGTQGFVVEGPTAGGHNAPPRGHMQLDETGQPIYGPRDVPDLEQIRELGLPFWLAGGYGDENKLQEALNHGAAGIQVGTAFAFCEESGIRADLKKRVLEMSKRGELTVHTDPLASPTGFPFKVLRMSQTAADEEVYQARKRICDLGYLRTSYMKEDGSVGYRCPAEPVEDYVRKGGNIEDTVGRKCVCNGLMATVGLGQNQKGTYEEPPLLTAGDEAAHVAKFLKPGKDSYTAKDVIDTLLAGVVAGV